MRDLDLALKIRLDGAEQVRRRLGEVEQSSERLRSGLARMGQALAGAFAVRELARASDAFAVAQGQVAALGRESGVLAANWDAVFAAAQRAGAGIGESAALVGSLGRNAANLGASAQDVLRVAEAVQAAMAVVPAGSAAASGALLQLAQLFGGVTVQAQEFNSLLDGAPRLVQAIEAGLGKTRAEIRELISQGRLLPEQVFAAILSQAQVLRAELEQAPDTITRSMTRLDNAWVQFVGQTAEASGAVNAVTLAIDTLAEHLDVVASIALAGGIGVLGGRVAALGATLLAAAKQARLAAAESAALGAATTAATRGAGLLRGGLALLGGPIGAITTALTLGATAWLIWGNHAKDATDAAKDGITQAREQLAALEKEGRIQSAGGGREGDERVKIAELERNRDQAQDQVRRFAEILRQTGRESPLLAYNRDLVEKLTAELDLRRKILAEMERQAALSPQAASISALPDTTGPLKGVNPELAENVRAAIEAAAKEGIELGISSGLRSTERQAELWAAALRKYGSAELARKNVAPPGTSRHEKGEAVDLSGDAAARDWLARNAGRFGLETYRGPGYTGHLHVQLRDLEREQKALADATKEAEESQREQSEAAKAAEEILSAHREELAQQAEAWKDTIDPMREHIRALDELTALYRAGAIDQPTYQAGQGIIAGRMKDTADGMVPPAEEGFNALREMAVEAAQQIHQAFADFLYRPWEGGLRGMLDSFVDMLHKMAAQILAQQAIMAFARAMGGTAGGTDIWSLVLGGATKMFHGGGLVGHDDRTYPPRQALAPDEVPAILQTGEQVLSRREVAAGYGRSPGEVVAGYLGRIGITHTAPGPGFVPSVPPTPSLAALPAQLLRGLPRYHDGGLVTGYAPAAQRTPEGSGAGPPTTVRIVNVQDPEVAADWIGSAAGERQILNVLRRNRAAIRREVIG